MWQVRLGYEVKWVAVALQGTKAQKTLTQEELAATRWTACAACTGNTYTRMHACNQVVSELERRKQQYR